MNRAVIGLELLTMSILGIGVASAEMDDAPWYRGKLSAMTGLSYSEGNYGGSADTRVWYVPFSLKYSFRGVGLTRWDRIDVRATVPYLWLKGPKGATFDSTGEVTPGTGDVQSNGGLGDVSLRLKYVYIPGADRPVLGFSTELEFPTGKESEGLGGGEMDVFSGAEISQTFEPFRAVRLTPFARVGYLWREDRRDQVRASGGLSVRLHDRLDVGASYRFAQRSSASSADRHELSPFAAIRATEHLSVEPFVLVGLSSSSAEVGGGLMFRASFKIGD